MKFKRKPTVGPDAPAGVVLDSDAHDLGINPETGAFRALRWVWLLTHFVCVSVCERYVVLSLATNDIMPTP